MSVSLAFVATNVLLYAYDHSEPAKQAKAEALLNELWEYCTGCLSIQALQEFYMNATRKLSLERPTARHITEDDALWLVHAPTTADVTDAIDLQETHLISFRDAMVVQSALTLGCEVLWAEDLNPGGRFGALELRTPF